MKKTILIVAMVESRHTLRWVEQVLSQDWEIHLFPSNFYEKPLPELSAVTIHPLWLQRSFTWINALTGNSSHNFLKAYSFFIRKVIEKYSPDFKAKQLLKVIDKIRPDLIHSMEIQAAGYMTLKARQLAPGSHFPTWLVTNWGSDIYMFGRLNEHKKKIKDVLAACDYYSCECERDVRLAHQFGFSGAVMPVFPNAGGFPLRELEKHRSTPTSERKAILLKGYQGWTGRALFGLRALERCADLLDGHEIVLYSADPDVRLAAELFSADTGIQTRILPDKTEHQEMLAWHGRARISVGLSKSDGISTSLLEAMVMGAFPIQSCTACADEWIQHGVSGLIVPPEDVEIIEQAIRKALTDDQLVDEAARANWVVAQTRLNSDVLRQKARETYSRLLMQPNASAVTEEAMPSRFNDVEK